MPQLNIHISDDLNSRRQEAGVTWREAIELGIAEAERRTAKLNKSVPVKNEKKK